MEHAIPQKGIDTELFTTNLTAGGKGGSEINFLTVEDGAVLTKIQAWAEGWRIRGVEVWMSNDTSKLIGVRTGVSHEFVFRDGELIQTLDLYGNNYFDKWRRLGAISFLTSQGRRWKIFCSRHDDKPLSVDVGSDICCGVFGASGADVDRLGFAMVRKVKSSRLVDVKYPNLGQQIVADMPAVVASQMFENGTKVEQSYIMEGSKSVSVSWDWSVTAKFELTVGVEVSAGIPLVADVKGKVEWTAGVESTYKRSETVVKQESWTWPVKCPPQTNVYATASVFSDKLNTEYTAMLELTLANGKVFKYNRKGRFEGVAVRMAAVKIEPFK